MKIKFRNEVEAAFLLISLLGIVGRQWVIPQISWQLQGVLFGLTFAVLNTVWVFHYGFNQWLNRRLPFEQGVAKRVAVQLLGGWLLVGIVLLVVGLFVINYLLPAVFRGSNPINRLNIIALGTGSLMANIALGLGFIASHFFNQWQANVFRAAQLEKEKVQVQLDTLKNQISPHFLFNSLSSLDSLIDDNPVLARQFLQQLSKVFRYVLQHKDKAMVPLETELAFIENYISLLHTRFDGTFMVRCDVDDDMLDRQIVPVTIQILIENAIKHNTISEARPLTVTINTNDGYLTITNPVQRKRQVETANGQGLENLKLLYSYLDSRPVQITEKEDVFRVRVPLLERL